MALFNSSVNWKVGQLHVALLQDWMRVVSNDSKVLSVVNRRRGEKGYRLLQGDNLRSLLLSLILQQVNFSFKSVFRLTPILCGWCVNVIGFASIQRMCEEYHCSD